MLDLGKFHRNPWGITKHNYVPIKGLWIEGLKKTINPSPIILNCMPTEPKKYAKMT